MENINYKALPAAQEYVKNRLIDILNKNQIILVSGEPGCGKTTLIPQHILHHMNGKKVICTQPRIIPTYEIAKRVASQMKVELGKDVGYRYRHNNFTSSVTVLSYVTDGTLLKEAYKDSMFSQYGAIIIDEAHERSTIIDLLLLFCKKALMNGAEIKVIIMSATIDLKIFKEYFKTLKVDELFIPGKLFEVSRIYQKPKKSLKESIVNVIQSILDKKGDILIFLCTKKEIDLHVKEFSEKFKEFKVYPLYSGLPIVDVKNATDPDSLGIRKIIFSTNVGETSLTIKGVTHVIDPGFVFSSLFSPKLGGQIMKKCQISQSSSIQRTGRAGRIENGVGILLYTETKFKKMEISDEPQIKKDDITSEILSLFYLLKQTRKVLEFLDNLITPPSPETVEYSFKLLQEYRAITSKPTYSGILRQGFKLANISIHPTQAHCIVEAKKIGCGNEMLHLMSLIDISTSLGDFVLQKKKNILPKIFYENKHQSGDHITLLNIYGEYLNTEDQYEWCQNNNLNFSRFEIATYTRDQLSYQTNINIEQIHLTNKRSKNIISILHKVYFHNIAINLIRLSDKNPIKIGLTLLDSPHDKIVFTNLCSFNKNIVVNLASYI